MSTINKINKNDCVGCGSCLNACPSQAISLSQDYYGFYYPQIDNMHCVECGVCLKSCPISECHYNEIKAVYAVSMKDNNIKRNSSSGGAFYWIASYFIENGGVVYGATFDSNDRCVKHIRVETKKQLCRLQNSKYVQSYIGHTYLQAKNDLLDGRLVLFSGTPCQVAGINAFLGHQCEKLFTCDILCYGVPSPLVLEKYLNETVGNKHITSLNMRDKTSGWSQYSMRISLDGKDYIKGKYEDLYHLGFQSHIFYRDSCYSCKFRRKERIGDFTLGDFWDFKESFKRNSIVNDGTGISFVAINTEKAESVFKKLDKELVVLEKRTVDENKDNYGFCRNMDISPHREEFFDRLNEGTYSEAIAPYITSEKLHSTSKMRKLYRRLKQNYHFRMLLYRVGVKL